MEKKKRTSKTQFKVYVNYLEKYDILKTGKLNPWDDPKIISALWENMTVELNATGDGPTRSSHDWKKVGKLLFSVMNEGENISLKFHKKKRYPVVLD